MAQRVASIFADIGLDAGDFDQGAATLSGAVDSLIGAVGNIHPAAAIAVSALTALGQFMMESAAAAKESAVAGAKVEAVIKATGGAAGITASEIDKLSSALSDQTGVDDELIASASAVMLTFRQVGEEVFPAAMQAAVDMSAVMGQDLQSSVVQLGKALNDPIAGITALSRVGVTFSEEQKQQIQNFMKLNDLAGAQGVILQELQKEFGGAAKAMNDAGDGSENLANAWGNMQSELGETLLPEVRKFNDFMTTSIKGWEQLFRFVNLSNAAMDEAASVHARMTEILFEQGVAYDAVSMSQYAQMTGGQEAAEATQEQIAAALAQAQAEIEAAKAVDENTAALENKTTAAVMDEEAVRMMTEANMQFLSVLGQIASQQQSYEEQLAAVQQRRIELQNEWAATPAWQQQGEKLVDYQNKLTELDAKETEITDKFKQNTAERILAMTEQKLALDGLTDKETEYLLEVGKGLGVYTQEQVDNTKKQLAESQKLADGFKQYQNEIVNAEEGRFATSTAAWDEYTGNVQSQLETNIQAINDYIDALGQIPTNITTNVSATLPNNEMSPSQQLASGGVNYYIQTAYISADNQISQVV